MEMPRLARSYAKYTARAKPSTLKMRGNRRHDTRLQQFHEHIAQLLRLLPGTLSPCPRQSTGNRITGRHVPASSETCLPKMGFRYRSFGGWRDRAIGLF